MKAVWSPRAVRHLVALRRYIERDSEQNAALVAERIPRAVDLLGTHPAIGRPGRVLGTRELVVVDTGFIIPYRVRAGRLELIAVFRGRQRRPHGLGQFSAPSALQ
jgi:toxin ParE1/3/4